MEMLDLLVWAQGQFGGGGRQPGFGTPPGGGGGGAGGLGVLCGGVGIVFVIFYLALIALMIAAWWKIFTKAGEPGWAAIVPVYSGMIWSKICGRGEMFGLLLLV